MYFITCLEHCHTLGEEMHSLKYLIIQVFYVKTVAMATSTEFSWNLKKSGIINYLMNGKWYLFEITFNMYITQAILFNSYLILSFQGQGHTKRSRSNCKKYIFAPNLPQLFLVLINIAVKCSLFYVWSYVIASSSELSADFKKWFLACRSCCIRGDIALPWQPSQILLWY